ncbi:hypothetical protein J6TS2_12250 [Heyndrickxia sporothermodurans]|nr:hypothetical protein J6TS2_12250 [Heyndrickxia sporothermodurans]
MVESSIEGDITLVYSAKDKEHNQAIVLIDERNVIIFHKKSFLSLIIWCGNFYIQRGTIFCLFLLKKQKG